MITTAITNDEYHSDVGRISKSGLDLIDRSPAHYYAKYLDPDSKRQEPTEAMETGTAGHLLILEPHKFESNYFLFDDSEKCDEIGGSKPRSTTKYKEWRREVFEEANGRKAIPPQQYELFRRLTDAVHNNPMARQILSDGVAEATVLFNDAETGAPCKCRPDWMSQKLACIADLKLVEDAGAHKFAKHCGDYRYFVQDPFYIDGVNSLDSDMYADTFVFIAVEKSPPYNVAVYELDGDARAYGRERYSQNLHTYMQCMRTGIWDGYPQGINRISLPKYIFYRH